MTPTERQLLRDCSTALNDWIVTYASDQCNKRTVAVAHERIMKHALRVFANPRDPQQKQVAAAWTRIMEHQGTLAYAADLRKRIKEALNE